MAESLRDLLFVECPDCDGRGDLGRVLFGSVQHRQADISKLAPCETCGGYADSLGHGFVLRDVIADDLEEELLEAVTEAEAIRIQCDALLAACEELTHYVAFIFETDECRCDEVNRPCWHCRAMQAVTDAEAAITKAKGE